MGLQAPHLVLELGNVQCLGNPSTHTCASAKWLQWATKEIKEGNAGRKVLRALRQIGRQLGENAARPPMSLFLSPLESVNFPKTLPHLLPLSWSSAGLFVDWVGGSAFYNLQIRTKPLSGLMSWGGWLCWAVEGTNGAPAMAPPPTSSHSQTRPWERLQSQRGILAVENGEYIPQCLLSFLYQHKAMNLAFCREHLARFLELQRVWLSLSVCPSLSVWEWSSHTHSMSRLGS